MEECMFFTPWVFHSGRVYEKSENDVSLHGTLEGAFFVPITLTSSCSFVAAWATNLHSISFESANEGPIAVCLLQGISIFKVCLGFQSKFPHFHSTSLLASDFNRTAM